jgi:hypothetical protein
MRVPLVTGKKKKKFTTQLEFYHKAQLSVAYSHTQLVLNNASQCFSFALVNSISLLSNISDISLGKALALASQSTETNSGHLKFTFQIPNQFESTLISTVTRLCFQYKFF